MNAKVIGATQQPTNTWTPYATATVRLALVVDGHLLTIGNAGQQKRRIDGKKRQVRTIINLPGGQVDLSETHAVAILREMKEELGLSIPREELESATVVKFGNQHIYRIKVDLPTLLQWMTDPSCTPWESNGVAFYKIVHCPSNDTIKCTTNAALNGVVNELLKELNTHNNNATGQLQQMEHYWFWTDNNIIETFSPNAVMLLTHKKDKCCRNNRINHELYRFLFATTPAGGR